MHALIVCHSPTSGFRLYGPFADDEHANAYAERIRDTDEPPESWALAVDESGSDGSGSFFALVGNPSEGWKVRGVWRDFDSAAASVGVADAWIMRADTPKPFLFECLGEQVCYIARREHRAVFVSQDHEFLSGEPFYISDDDGFLFAVRFAHQTEDAVTFADLAQMHTFSIPRDAISHEVCTLKPTE